MSLDTHDQYCGSFGPFSDCPACSAFEQKATATKQKKRMRLPTKGQPTTGKHWIDDRLAEINRLLSNYFK